ncbi:MAG TPA: hypothetical protein VFR70_01380 [Flavobacterium sp.]|nr:hypothetical protein [Flavobacterium sp.]
MTISPTASALSASSLISRTALVLGFLGILLAAGQAAAQGREKSPYSYSSNYKAGLLSALKKYSSGDASVAGIKKAMALFEKSKAPKERIKLNCGVAYVLSPDDCGTEGCKAPQLYPCVIFEEDGQFNIKALRNSQRPEASEDYVNLYLANDLSLGGNAVFQYIQSKGADPEYLTGMASAGPNESVVIDDTSITFLRESKGWIIGMSTDKHFGNERMIVYLFRTSLETLPDEDLFLRKP